jgi:hypothetical protein
MKLFPGRTIVNTPGIAVPLSESSLLVRTVSGFAFAANTDDVHVGDRRVRARVGEASGALLDARESFTFDNVDLSEVWIDAIVANEGVTWLAQL